VGSNVAGGTQKDLRQSFIYTNKNKSHFWAIIAQLLGFVFKNGVSQILPIEPASLTYALTEILDVAED
jgi:hypothetical protein